VPARRPVVAPSSAFGPPSQPGHVRSRARFIQKDKPVRINAFLHDPPLVASDFDISPVLLVGSQCFFYIYIQADAGLCG
ncbi:hypothetical protein V6C53_20865, partial [Desulfocurvibacter africanus]|uniref:hypothetical protein n=1 Tax=Desulfocurvibacter africanus TaxID=873 RepID=UPI002FD98973